MHVLVTSPIPTHPQNHGNRARVYSVCRALQTRGYVVHFVYGGLEGLTAAQESAMRQQWDHTYILAAGAHTKKKSRKKHHLIDDWYTGDMTALTQRIMAVWDIRMCLANYVWYSRWLAHVQDDISKIIDTHDIFADRDARLAGDGINAVWFSTTENEEAKALKRADIVLAIQNDEAEYFRRLTKKTETNVHILGHLASENFQGKPKAAAGRQKLKVGYLASDNPINQHSLNLLTREIAANSVLADSCTFFIAGALSETAAAQQSFFKRLGFIDDAAQFHYDMDIMINPNIGGTGLKIKSVDALSYGVPLLATADAMVGLAVDSPHHQCTDVAALCATLLEMTTDRGALALLAQESRVVFSRYQNAQQHSLDALFPIAGEQS